ncbi:hypothetical protein BSZ14_17340 [Sphingomonas sp. Sph1(2015)]|jgi:hypothetical protein|uniref:hypothetical protein n=1 Tax=Sphingomonas sp. Sph1(2015) TaxID=1628084 RepID=UPI000975BCA0|nr:hypothetical protein [Sphingomonas sp. Sph1(2015)]OMJ30714.1 hypothetical protein BSZ14_17340 [Sphingomonas sp. Sph1(2015)]
MPTSARPLWILTGLLLAFYPVLNFVYWPQVLRSGVLPPNGDSIGIPMYGSILVTIVASPIVLGIAWLCLRRYDPATRLAKIRWDRPIRTVAASLVFGGAAVLCVFASVAELGHAMPWYEYLWAGYALAWVPWLLGIRAAVIDQENTAGD